MAMDQSSMNQLSNSAFMEALKKAIPVMDVSELAKQNSDRLLDKDTSGCYIPTESDIEKMKQWMITYKRANPSLSKRQIRLACQNNFNIKTFETT